MDVTQEILQRNSEEEFRQSLSTYVDSGTAVIHVRTGEVMRCLLALRRQALTGRNEYHEWDVVNGFRQFSLEDMSSITKKGDGNIDISSAFSEPMNAIDSYREERMRYYVFVNPHVFMEGNPHMSHLVMHYASVLPATNICVVMVTPDIPLPGDVPVDLLSLTFDPPGLSELQDTLADVLDGVKEGFDGGAEMTEEDIERVCYVGAGMTAHSFETYASLAAIRAAREGKDTLTADDIIKGVTVGKTDVVNANDILELYPSTSIDNVGGMENLKSWVHKRAGCYSDKAKEFGVEPPKGMVLVGPPGCQPAGSKVLMADGLFSNIEDVQVGDVVLSPQHDGSVVPVEVAETVVYRDQQVFRIASKGRKPVGYRCAHNHVMPIKFRGDLYEVQAEEHLSMGKEFQDRATLFTTDAYDLPEREYRVHPYVMGCFIGDGHFAPNVPAYNPGFTNPSVDIFNRMESLGAEFGKRTWRSGSWRAYATGAFAVALKESELAGHLSAEKYIPAEYLQGSLEQRLAMLAGLIDTDGTFEEFSSASKRLSDDFVFLVRSVGGKASVVPGETTCQTGTFGRYRVHYSFGACRPSLCLAYKQRPITEKGLAGHRNKRFTVEKDTVEDVYGIRLASGSHWYITDDFIVTKNTGKSLVAKAVSSVLGVPLVRLDFGRVFNSLVGASEERMRVALHMVEKMAPVVIFCDEIDKGLGGIGGSGDSGVSSRVLGTFLTWLNDCKYPVFTIMTANNVTGLPPELLRRGRFDAIFSTSLPTPRERTEVLRIHLGLRGRDISTFDSEDTARVVSMLEGYVPAEIESAVKDALVDAFSDGVELEMSHIEKAAKAMVPLSVAFKAQIETMNEWAKNNATPVSRDDSETAAALQLNRRRVLNRSRSK